jgi:UDP-glucose 4-epimerase
VSPYGCAKVSVELYLGFYRAQYGLDYTALRYSNVYGPRQSPHGEAGVVAIFCQRFLKGLPAVINGDGAQTRDYVHVSDVAKANVLALEKGSCMGINIATGVEADVNHLFRTLRDAAGSSQAEVHGPPAAGEQRRSVLENRLAFDELGWYPEVSLQEGLASTLDWFRSREKEGSRW